MITLPKVKLEKVCVDKNGMQALQDPFFTPNVSIDKWGNTEDTPGHGTLAAANGFILAVLPVEHGEEDTAGPIPNAMIKASHKIAKKKPATLDAAAIEDRYDGHYPNVAEVVSWRADEDLVSVSLDAEQLYNLADALCEREHIRTAPLRFVRLTFSTSKPNIPIFVEPYNGKGDGFGILMPVRTRE